VSSLIGEKINTYRSCS